MALIEDAEDDDVGAETLTVTYFTRIHNLSKQLSLPCGLLPAFMDEDKRE